MEMGKPWVKRKVFGKSFFWKLKIPNLELTLGNWGNPLGMATKKLNLGI